MQISDGAVQTAGVSVSVRGQGGASGAGAGTTVFDNGILEYTPTQGETDFTSFIVVAFKAGCIPVAVTVVTSASATPGNAGIDWGKVINPTAAVGLTNTTVGTLTTYTGNTPQTGDSFARIGVAGAGLTNIDLPNQTFDLIGNITGNLSGSAGSVTGLTASDVAAIKTKTDSLTFTVAGEVNANARYISGSSAAADNLEESTEAIGYGTVDGTGATTTVFLTSALTPDSAVNDQFNGRVLIFKNDTTTAALRGQATTIGDWAHTSAEIGTFTVVSLTTAPQTGDTFTIL